MAAQSSILHLDVETQAMLSRETVPRLKMIWFAQGMGLAALMLLGVAALNSVTHNNTSAGRDSELGFVPSMPGISTGGIHSAMTSARKYAQAPMMQVRDRTVAELSTGRSIESAGFTPETSPGSAPAQLIQGGSLRTWSYRSPDVDQLQVVLSTEGRPLDSDIELWHGPDNTPFKMRVYSENGQHRPFSAVLETPRGPNTVAIRNIGQMEFPIAANVIHHEVDQPTAEALNDAQTIQGGALRTYPFDPRVDSVQVLLTTDGRPLNARIELLQGPNNNKQVIELYSEDGRDRQFFAIMETPGSGNVIRIVNTAPVEFPMRASVVPNSINSNPYTDAVLGGDVVIGGDVGW